VSVPQLLVHDRKDNVGVVVVEDLKNVPIGHKVALVDLKVGDTVIKYGQDIGRIVTPVARGEHVHVHNLKTKRW
jgi:(2R)-sulfolactate sulfo-lyase subunit alpha